MVGLAFYQRLKDINIKLFIFLDTLFIEESSISPGLEKTIFTAKIGSLSN
jgi:hypothetical protein